MVVSTGRFRLGVDEACAHPSTIRANGPVALFTTRRTMDASGICVIDRLLAAGVEIRTLLAPEHGLWGHHPPGMSIGDGIDEATGLPVRSMFGLHASGSEDSEEGPQDGLLAVPSEDPLRRSGAVRRVDERVDVVPDDVGAIVCDVPDVGARYHTFLSSLRSILMVAAERGLPVVVLDRPNPIGEGIMQGLPLESGRESFVGCSAGLYNRHGLRVGQIAHRMNRFYRLGAALEVLGGPEDGKAATGLWQDTLGLPWFPPVPNLPSLEAAALYTGLCLLEGTNLTMGRGTPMPFQVVGAPWLDARAVLADLRDLGTPGVVGAEVRFVPSAYTHVGEECQGILFRIVDRQAATPFALACWLLHLIERNHRERLEWVRVPTHPHGNRGPNEAPASTADAELVFFDVLAGTDGLRQALGDRDELSALLSSAGPAQHGGSGGDPDGD